MRTSLDLLLKEGFAKHTIILGSMGKSRFVFILRDLFANFMTGYLSIMAERR
jgi:hypothetical protein